MRLHGSVSAQSSHLFVTAPTAHSLIILSFSIHDITTPPPTTSDGVE